jgi:hypothetical protein
VFPLLLVLLVTADPRTTSGLVTLQERVEVQLLAPDAIVQGLGLAERVPDITGGSVQAKLVVIGSLYEPAPAPLSNLV